MELHKIRGGSKEELYNKQYNIGVGISLGNKWFTLENILGLIRWAMDHTKEYVVVYVADEIHAINLEVRKRISYERAIVMADDLGTFLLEDIKREVERTIPLEAQKRIHYVKWKEISDDAYKAKVKYLYDFYKINEKFRNWLIDIVRNTLSKETSPRSFSEEEIIRLSDYIIEELPEQMARVRMDGRSCDAFVYPYDGKILELAEKIQKGEEFPEIKEHVLDTEPKVFLEVR